MKFPSYIGPFSGGYQHLPTTTYNGETVSAGLPGPLRSVSPGRAEVPAARCDKTGMTNDTEKSHALRLWMEIPPKKAKIKELICLFLTCFFLFVLNFSSNMGRYGRVTVDNPKDPDVS